ncbi:hypothetical protein [Planctomicrobium piriforme]|uniref:Uncharacterized protein n=1 Tax=Planctomicrobium piriforme TaxID=1576369 RepID=A0A1I3NM05_9PLAN|nr:hypothetical protein [Planctomicrobium piriforme]SFJ10235.1 hypothetical protein SAMN05421753_115139 [Planctomicrobium piriforme]
MSTARMLSFGLLATTFLACSLSADESPRMISGIDPQLAYFNDEGECGTGAVVPWADRLWVITYAPHKPQGSSDKLYEITADHQLIVRPESIGGTPANRMIHPESKQLFIGPYVIDGQCKVRVIPPSAMYGRLTGNARHLIDPAHKIYFATMEEGIYEVDVNTLAVTELWTDEQRKNGRHADLPGYHGKGLYSSQGQLVYANNGEHGDKALSRPEIPSGVLASWNGHADAWHIVRRNQFTEVTGPGGIHGNSDPEHDPVWSIGWDHRSLLLAVFDHEKWHFYRLPKSSHSYDGAHGWNTEWPRIREIGEDDLLMTMHGAFWRFPKTFAATNSAGISPRSNYLKVVGDFCRWGDDVVLGCDDAAHSEFLNKRKLKGHTIPAGQSQSNLQFLKPAQLDHIGPIIGRGAVWLKEEVTKDTPSDPYLFKGYDRRTLHVSHKNNAPLAFTIEVDEKGNGEWQKLRNVTVPVENGLWIDFPAAETAAWVRLIPVENGKSVTAFFQYANRDDRSTTPDPMFDAIARAGNKNVTGGLLHARGENFRTLRFVARDANGEIGGYDLDAQLKLKRIDDAAGVNYVKEKLSIPQNVIEIDNASVLYIDEARRRWRFPKGDAALSEPGPLGPERVCREVCTERDLLNIAGTFYELPAENAGGVSRLRPVATHNRRISDFTSYRGLLVLSGLSTGSEPNEHVISSDDGKCSLWVGGVDDLWKFGKPRGTGGPWNDSLVQAGVPSDPYLMTGYDRKRLQLSHTGQSAVSFTVEADFTGLGDWVPWHQLVVSPGQTMDYEFPEAFNCDWIRVVPSASLVATATFIYD